MGFWGFGVLGGAGGSLANILNAGHPSEVKGHDSTQFNTCDAFSAGGKAPEEFQVQVKKASTPSGAEERPNGMQLDSKSPKTSPTENEMDPNQTTCDACKITQLWIRASAKFHKCKMYRSF